MKRLAGCVTMFVLSMLATPSALSGQASPWVKVGEVGGAESTSFVDTSTAVREPSGLALVRIALWYAKGHVPSTLSAAARFTTTAYEFDCERRTFRIGAGVAYDSAGHVLTRDDDPTFSAWVDPQPATTGEGLVSGVCDILRRMKLAN